MRRGCTTGIGLSRVTNSDSKPIKQPSSNREMRSDHYLDFLEAKINLATKSGFDVDASEINPILFPHQRDIA